MGRGKEETPVTRFLVILAQSALDSLGRIKDRRLREDLKKRIDSLAEEPEKKGKPLVAELLGYRSLRAGRYRVIYRVHADRVEVVVVAVGKRSEGSREDIYSLAKKLIRLGLAP